MNGNLHFWKWFYAGLILLILPAFSAFSQKKKCPVCTPDSTCNISSVYPAFCQTKFPDGQVGNFYNEVVSFRMPRIIKDPITLSDMKLIEFEVQSINRVPLGFSYNTNIYPIKTYFPNSGLSEAQNGCIRLSGMPDKLYLDSIVMDIRMLVVDTIGDSLTQYLKLKIPLSIKMGVSVKDGLTVYNPTGCSPLTVNFKANNASNGKPSFKYYWDFGNGVKDSVENPGAQVYNTPGTYKVILETRIDTFYISHYDVITSTCTDPTSNPDFYVRIWQGGNDLLNTKYFPYEAKNNKAAPLSIQFRPLLLGNYIYATELLDDDLDEFKSDDTCGLTSFNGFQPGVFTRTLGSSEVRYEVVHGTVIYKDTISVVVTKNPPVPHISYVTRDSVCLGDSILLTTQQGFIYDWFHNGMPISGATSNKYFANQTGNYMVKATWGNTCSSNSSPASIFFMNISKPMITSSPDSSVLFTDSASGTMLQWFLNDNIINGANQYMFFPQSPGYYYVMAYDYLGCQSISDTVYVSSISTQMPSNESLNMRLQMMPNPSKGVFKIQGFAKPHSWVYISVHDIWGRNILDEKFFAEQPNFLSAMDLSAEKKGIYFLRIQNEHLCITKKIVIE